MSSIRKPRNASLQFWPRKRATTQIARVRAWAKVKDAKPIGFAGYKAGMTHLIVNDNCPNSKTKGKSIVLPATVIECPPLKVAGAVLYTKKGGYGLSVSAHIFAEKLDKELGRSISLPKKAPKKIADVKHEDFEDIRILVHTQPKLVSFGKKKPELFEIALGGSKEEKLNFAKERVGKEIMVNEVFAPGQQLDIHSVTKGKGLEGPVGRHGIAMKSHKSEKGRRSAVLNSEGDAKVRFYAHQSGQKGYHQRTEWNKWLLKIGEPKDANQKGGFLHYGVLMNPCVIVKGSVGGAAKRLIKFTHSIRPNHKVPKDAPGIEYLSTTSKQGK